MLSFFLSEYQEFSRSAYSKSVVYMDWEIREISRNYDDTNLGDFIFKMPNPDCMPASMVKKG